MHQRGWVANSIVKGKGKKDRYSILSKNVLAELRAYFKKYRPKEYLFNGRKKGQKMSEGAIRHALENARKRSGIVSAIARRGCKINFLFAMIFTEGVK